MISESDERLLRRSYSEIIYGFSIYARSTDTIYVKHFSPLDNLEVDFLYTESYNKAKERGYPTEKDRLQQLKEDRLWTEGDENNLEGVKASIKSAMLAKKKVFLKKDIEALNSQIKEEENLLLNLISKRDILINATVEKFTRKNIDAYLIYKSFFKDIALTKLIYTQEDFNELDQSDLNNLFITYNTVMENFSDTNIRKIALSGFFQNAYSLCDSVYEFYGKPICYLTNLQIQLSAYGGYYKQILTSEMKPPDEILSDPEKLEDWYTSRTNAEQMLDKNVTQEDGAVSVMGATKEDLKNWGYDQQGVSLAEATKKAGGVMDKEQLMKLYKVE